MKKRVSISTVHSIKQDYLEDMATAQFDVDDYEALLPKKRGRPVLLGQFLDDKLQLYIKKVREGGGIISAAVVVAAAHGILTAYDRCKLREFGGHVNLNRQWAYGFLHRMNFVKRKATTSKSRYSEADFKELKLSFLKDVVSTVMMEDVPMELILNWDQTGIKIVPSSCWTMEKQGSQQVEISGIGDKRMITAVFLWYINW